MSVEFIIRAVADAQTIPRLFEHFALRNLIPAWVSAETVDDYIHITVRHTTMDDGIANMIAEKMRAAVLVAHVKIMMIAEQGGDAV